MPATPWYNENRNRTFPLVTASVLPASPGLPDDVLVDAGFLLGPEADFDAALHTVVLESVSRVGDYFYFRFAADTPQLYDRPLLFVRHLTDPDYTYEDLDSVDAFDSESGYLISFSDSDSAVAYDLCGTPLWSGYLVTGTLATLAALLGDGETWTGGEGTWRVEPALLYNQSRSLVTALHLANADRTRATAPLDCPGPTWPHQTGVIFVQATCLVGEIHWKPGYNCAITQNAADNSLTIAAVVGAGAGQPCEEPVPLFLQEQPPQGADDNALFEGSYRCNETLRSLNGLGGPTLQLLAGDGVSIQSDPVNHRLVIDVDMRGMAICFTPESESEENG